MSLWAVLQEVASKPSVALPRDPPSERAGLSAPERAQQMGLPDAG